MIKLAVEDYCQNCSNFIPDADSIAMNYDYDEIIETTVFCKNNKLCENMYSHLKKEIKND